MASVFQRTRWVKADGTKVPKEEALRLIALGEQIEERVGPAWYLNYVDENDRRFTTRSRATTKTEAKRLAVEAELRAERVRRGLDAALPKDGGGTLAELMEWWLETCRKGKAGYASERSGARIHIKKTNFGTMTLLQFNSAMAEQLLLQVQKSGLSLQTVAHVRGYLSRAFNKARKMGRWSGRNPIEDVDGVKIPKYVADYLRAEEIPAVIEALPPEWRALFATAILAGLRRGELFALRKCDVDLGSSLITVRRSHERDTPKGGEADTVPISSELAPFLRAAMEASPSELVFPASDGSMRSRDTDMPRVLRTAMARAGLVEGYRFVCRAKVDSRFSGALPVIHLAAA